MNHHVDWVESLSLYYKLDGARYLCTVSVCRSTQRDSCVTERSLSLLWDCIVFSLLLWVKKTALSHVTSHFQSGPGRRAAEEHPARWATMATFSLRALWLSQWRAEKSRSAGMCVPLYDYTWWKEDVLFTRAVRLGSGNASDVALETMHVFKFTTQQAARVVEQPQEQAQA